MAPEVKSANPQPPPEERFVNGGLSTFLALISAATEMTADTDDISRDAEAGITANTRQSGR